MLRRDLLKLAVQRGAVLLPIGPSAWAAVGESLAAAPPRLVVIFLRGAVDGLSVVVPHADDAYHAARPSIALARPGDDGGVLDLDGHFGLHPALAPLMPLWRAGQLGFVQACGSPDATRSHFDAQDYMESGTPGRKSTADGWLNRLLGVLPPDPSGAAPATRAVSMGPVLPRIYAGRNSVANVPLGAAAGKPTLLDRPQVAEAFGRLYGGDDALSRAFQASRQSHQEVMRSMNADSLEREMQAASNGAPLPNGFPDNAARLATLMRNDPRVQLAFMDLGGWDTHANQGAASGQLANRLGPLGQGLSAFATRLGPVWDDTVVVVMSEFGRTVRQNGNGGTDHGHGNVMWLLGGRVAGGRVHGRWPGLDDGALHEGRDLAVTTDFRQVLAEIGERHLLLQAARMAELFPGFAFRAPGAARGLMRA
ncbi:DUF1501 domain-containing protein [Variovorax sp. J31P207]|uniref:DUF1501 domain-containing protein n=1 Tax=Variovorax sp. J31P207 TaxID=3053510 RepID=UPI002577A8E7|nr:DUF1501 domain-containing protein [Variovorax sp. J31P207]MDM0065834.1 DUF1501 domain-containing protein [Variovorax sp. J31P207]